MKITARREPLPPHFWDDPARRPNRKAVYVGPLTTQQHILHLLLTIVTGGLWLPVWIFRASRGNYR